MDWRVSYGCNRDCNICAHFITRILFNVALVTNVYSPSKMVLKYEGDFDWLVSFSVTCKTHDIILLFFSDAPSLEQKIFPLRVFSSRFEKIRKQMEDRTKNKAITHKYRLHLNRGRSLRFILRKKDSDRKQHRDSHITISS